KPLMPSSKFHAYPPVCRVIGETTRAREKRRSSQENRPRLGAVFLRQRSLPLHTQKASTPKPVGHWLVTINLYSAWPPEPSMPKQKLLRIQQRPVHVFPGFALVLSLGDVIERHLDLVVGRQARQGG